MLFRSSPRHVLPTLPHLPHLCFSQTPSIPVWSDQHTSWTQTLACASPCAVVSNALRKRCLFSPRHHHHVCPGPMPPVVVLPRTASSTSLAFKDEPTDSSRFCRKFGKHIQKRQLEIPEYAASFVDYKALKKVPGVPFEPPCLFRRPQLLTRSSSSSKDSVLLR